MEEVLEYTYAIHDHCLPRSGAYHEIFLMHGEEMAEKDVNHALRPNECALNTPLHNGGEHVSWE
eukprot:4170310-Amphidinium_carterae.2